MGDLENAPLTKKNPLYLHSSDHPGLSLVSEVFDGQNFDEWRISMKIALSAKNKSGFITRKLSRPEKTDPKHDRWERCNDMIRSWILNGLSKEIRRSVLYNETAQGIWEELGLRYGQVSGAQLYVVKKELNGLTQGSDSTSTYFTKMKALWDELNSLRCFPKCTCGSVKEFMKFEEDERLVHFLMGLNDDYTMIRGAILMQSPLSVLAQGYSMILQEEKQRENRNSTQVHQESASMDAVVNKPGSKAPPSKGNGEKKILFCTNCKKTNHNVDRCFFIHGFLDKYRNRNKKQSPDGKFAEAAHDRSGGGLPELKPEQMTKLLSLLSTSSPQGKSEVQDEFAGFAGKKLDEYLPAEDYFYKGLYMLDIGQNDLAGAFYSKTYDDVVASIPAYLAEFQAGIQRLYDEGARNFWIHNTGPLGCLAQNIAKFGTPKSKLDEIGCVQTHNEAAKVFNQQLHDLCQRLQQGQYADINITYVDVFAVKSDLIRNYSKYGFEEPVTVCCGYGGPPLNYDSRVGCGTSAVVNGTSVTAKGCGDASKYVNWDGIHYTEAANHHVALQILARNYASSAYLDNLHFLVTPQA